MEDFDIEKFQGEVITWAHHNFPNSDHMNPLVGLTEEMGELFETFQCHHTCGWTGTQKDSNWVDAVGDMMIFLAHYCALNGYHFLQCYDRVNADYQIMLWTSYDSLLELPVQVGKLCHAHLKKKQNIRTGEKHSENAERAIGAIINLCRLLCEHRDRNLTDVIELTWGHVQKRDWKADPVNGRMG